MLQQYGTSLPRFFVRRMIDLIALIAAFAIGMPFVLVAASPFLQGL